jgi:hypothetical protein
VDFFKLTIPQSPPSHFWDYSICNNARIEFSTIFVPSFDPNEWCLKNGLHSEGLNPGPLGHESTALTTRPWLLDNFKLLYVGYTSKIEARNINVIFITKHILKYSDLKDLHLLCTTILSL